MPPQYEPNQTFVRAAHELINAMKSLKASYNGLQTGSFSLSVESLGNVQDAVSRLRSRGEIAEIDRSVVADLGSPLSSHLPETEMFSLHRGRENVLRLLVRLPGTRPTVIAAQSFGIGVWNGEGYTDQVRMGAGSAERFLAENRIDLLARATEHEFREGHEIG